jgi:tetratricopeptide (TPR) repeat protein
VRAGAPAKVEQPEPGMLTFVSGASAILGHGIPERVPEADTDGLDMGPEQSRLLALVDGVRSADDIVAQSGMPVMLAASGLGVLADLGLVRFRKEGKAPSRKAPAPVPVSGSGPTSRLPPPQAGPARPAGPAAPLHELRQASEAMAAGDFKAARAYAKKAKAQAPTHPEVVKLDRHLNDPAQALARAKVLYDLGAKAQGAANMKQAADLFRAALAENEASAGIHARLGLVLIHLKAPLDEAEEHFLRAVELAPDNQTYKDNLARVQSRMRKPPGRG